MRRFFSNILAIVLLLAPVLQVLGQGAPACSGSPSLVSLWTATPAATGCCSERTTRTASLSPACGSGHQCCTTDAPMPEQPLAVVENRSLPSADLKAFVAFVEHRQSKFFIQKKIGSRTGPLALQAPPTNALRCSLIQRWRI